LFIAKENQTNKQKKEKNQQISLPQKSDANRNFELFQHSNLLTEFSIEAVIMYNPPVYLKWNVLLGH
jgi:hypothetical protein